MDVVPRVVVSGGQSAGGTGSAMGGGNNLIEGLLTLMLSEKMGVKLGDELAAPRSPEAEAMRSQIYQSIQARPKDKPVDSNDSKS